VVKIHVRQHIIETTNDIIVVDASRVLREGATKNRRLQDGNLPVIRKKLSAIYVGLKLATQVRL
jgi:hypothetical protein